MYIRHDFFQFMSFLFDITLQFKHVKFILFIYSFIENNIKYFSYYYHILSLFILNIYLLLDADLVNKLKLFANMQV